jgi:hypothetical protein
MLSQGAQRQTQKRRAMPVRMPQYRTTQFLAAVPASLFPTGIASLEGRRHDTIAPLDLLFQGF